MRGRVPTQPGERTAVGARRGAAAFVALALGMALGAVAAADSAPEPRSPDAAPLDAEAAGLVPELEALPSELEAELEAEEAEPDESDAAAEELLAEEHLDPRDPLEPMNRAVFGANRALDRFAFEPLARGYRWLVPGPGRRAVQRVFDNLNAPVVFVNDLLQLAPRRAGRTGARFVLNTTAGVGGIFDVAHRVGLEGHSADFGQTLGRAGVGAGAYVMLPLFGPSTVRDAVGQLVDAALRPDTWLLSPGGRLMLASAGGFAEREAHLLDLEELERSSVDFYATLRSVYLISRQRAIEPAED